MRLVVCLFAESRQLLPVNDPIYAQAYGVRSLYELLDEATRNEGGTHVLFNRQMAWSRLMALFRLIHGGSSHGAFAMRAYGGALFRPGDAQSPSPVDRALHILEHAVSVGDATVYHVLRKLLRGPLPVVKGHQKTFVDGPVDYTDLRTEFIGLIYEGLLDYRLKRTDEQTGPQVFLNLGREPVLPLARLRDMLENDRKGLKDLLTTLRKEKVTASVASEEEETEEEAEEQEEAEEESGEEVVAEPEARRRRNPTHGRLPGCGGSGQAVGQGSRRTGCAGRQARKEGIRQRIPDPHRGRSDQAHQPRGCARRVLSGPSGQHPQGHRHVLHPAPVGRADRPSHLGAVVLHQVPSPAERGPG